MKIMVVGGGGREHTIIRKLKENPAAEVIYALPGNGGMSADAECVQIAADETDKIVRFALDNAVDYAVVSPDGPLVAGCVDALEDASVPCFGPRSSAAVIEGSKIFAKELMRKYGIPTAKFKVFSKPDEALEYLESAPVPTVIKADGLALGKGVIIAETRREAKDAVISMMCGRRFGDSGARIVIEELLSGPEVSVLAFTDGKTLVPMVSCMDHKRAFDGDRGPNTGGMGSVAPNPCYTTETAKLCMDTIFMPTVRAMNAEGRPFKGCLYFGLMLTESGPAVIEYNCRFGDPEAQAVLALLESDLLDIMLAVTEERLSPSMVKFAEGKSACCVVMASEGYPKKYESGFKVSIPEDLKDKTLTAGVRREGGELVSCGGRVLGTVAVADSLESAVGEAYRQAGRIKFKNSYYRGDIGQKALKAGKSGL